MAEVHMEQVSISKKLKETLVPFKQKNPTLLCHFENQVVLHVKPVKTHEEKTSDCQWEGQARQTQDVQSSATGEPKGGF